MPYPRHAAASLIAAILIGPAAALALATAGSVPARAQACSGDAFAKVVNESGAALRRLSAETQPKIQAAIRRLKDKYNWHDDEFVEKANAMTTDSRSEALDQKAAELLARLDRLAEERPEAPDSCSRLAELEAAALELRATVKAKTEYQLARLDAAASTAPPEAKSQPKPLPGKAEELRAPPRPLPAAKAPPDETRKPREAPTTGDAQAGWSARALPDHSVAENALPIKPLPEREYVQPGKPYAPPPVDAAQGGYTLDEIRTATRGFFGTVSTGLASIIEYTFQKIGKPSAYVLGNEGGGALLAGLRYGKGHLYLRNGGKREVYWHGPSIGYDLGAAGSKTMFLVYGLKDADGLFGGFTGVDGSAYVVGGVGLTLLTDGRVTMAPIRSGLGLRIGANVGYIRFTPRPTWNPF